MRIQKCIKFSAILILFSFANAEKYRGEILRLFYLPNSVGMGNTGVAYTPNPLFSTINPAIKTAGSAAYFSHSEIYSGFISLESAYLYSGDLLQGLGSGIFINILHSDKLDVTEITDSSSTPEEGNINIITRKPYFFYNINIITSREINNKAGFGISLKIFREQFYDYAENGIGVDIGYFLQTQKVNYGIVLRDAFYSVFKGNSIETLSPSVLAGINITQDKIRWNLELEVFSDGPYPGALFSYRNFSLEGRTGFSYSINPNIDIRFGFQRGYLSAGIGLKYIRFLLDYSLSPHPDLELSHRIGAGICF